MQGDLLQWGCNLNRVMKTSQSPTRTRTMRRERMGHAPGQGGGEKRRVPEGRVVGGEAVSLTGGGRCHLNARFLPQKGREAKGAACFDKLCPLRTSAPLRQTRASGNVMHSRGSSSGAMVWGGVLAESSSVLPLSARAIPDQARVFAIFGCHAHGRTGSFAISICEVAGRVCEVAGRARNSAISFCKVAGRAENFAISFCEVTGRAENFAISVCEVVGRAENLAISVCEVAGRARNFAISFCEVAGRADNFASSFCEVAQRTGQGARVAENRPGRNMNLMDGAGMNLRRGDRLADRRRMAHAALFHARAGRQGAASQRRGRHVPLILLGAGGFTAVSLCQHDNPEN